MFRVAGSTSTRTGRAPPCSITLTEAQKVIGVVITSSPGPIPSVASAVCSPAVQEFSARAPGAPTNAANSRSNVRVLGPVVIQADLSVSTTASISACPICGGANARNVRRRAGAGARGIGEGGRTPPAGTPPDRSGARPPPPPPNPARARTRGRPPRCRVGRPRRRPASIARRGHSRPAGGGLALEERQHAAIGPEHVAEAYGPETSPRRREIRQLEHDPLGDPLRGAQHAGRVDRLVGRDQHEFLDTVPRRGFRDAQRPD